MTDHQPTQVAQGAWVKLSGFVPGEEEVFHLVSPSEADYLENRLPPESPLARVLLGAKVGDKVRFNAPAGEVELTVLETGRD